MKIAKRSLPKIIWVLPVLVLGIGLFAYGSSYFVQRHNATAPRSLPKPQTVITSSTDHPSEAPVNTKTASYTVASDMPRLLVIPRVGTNGFVQQVAVDKKTNEMAVPSNIHMAGWYTGSVKPGDVGLSIIDGHLLGYYTPGIFQNLSDVRPGDTFYIEFGDGSRRNFQVVSNHTYPVGDVVNYLFAKDPSIQAQLNLITCGGQYDKSQHEYNQRVLVVAKRI
jgi:sortase (surface protein transpeptidase)